MKSLKGVNYLRLDAAKIEIVFPKNESADLYREVYQKLESEINDQ
jgi:hypothetical protein